MKTDIIVDKENSYFKFTSNDGEPFYCEIEDNSCIELSQQKLFDLLKTDWIFEQFILNITKTGGKYNVVFEKGY